MTDFWKYVFIVPFRL